MKDENFFKSELSKRKVKDANKILEYIFFCISKKDLKTNKYIKGVTEHHHILPSSLYPEYSNLKKNAWNGVHLTYEDHYKTHSILVEALSDNKMLMAWFNMGNIKDLHKEGCYKESKERALEYLSKTVVARPLGSSEKYRRILLEDFYKGKWEIPTANMVPVSNKEGLRFSVHKDYYHINKHNLSPFIGTKMPVREVGTDKKLSVSSEEFKSGRYIALSKDRVGAIAEDGSRAIVSSEEYANGNYSHANSGKTSCLDLEGNKVTVSTDEYRKNRNKYIHPNEGKISVYKRDTLDQVFITTEEYIKNKSKYKIPTEGTLTAYNDKGIKTRITKEEYYSHSNSLLLTARDILGESKAIQVTREFYLANRNYIQNSSKYVYLYNGQYYRSADLVELSGKVNVPRKYKKVKISIKEYTAILSKKTV